MMTIQSFAPIRSLGQLRTPEVVLVRRFRFQTGLGVKEHFLRLRLQYLAAALPPVLGFLKIRTKETLPGLSSMIYCLEFLFFSPMAVVSWD